MLKEFLKTAIAYILFVLLYTGLWLVFAAITKIENWFGSAGRLWRRDDELKRC
jgi:hypothetical protein